MSYPHWQSHSGIVSNLEDEHGDRDYLTRSTQTGSSDHAVHSDYEPPGVFFFGFGHGSRVDTPPATRSLREYLRTAWSSLQRRTFDMNSNNVKIQTSNILCSRKHMQDMHVPTKNQYEMSAVSQASSRRNKVRIVPDKNFERKNKVRQRLLAKLKKKQQKK